MEKVRRRQDYKKQLLSGGWLFLLLLLGIAGMAAGYFWDLPIAAAVYNPDAVWARYLAAYGAAPCFWCLCLGGLLFFRISADKNWLLKLVYWVMALGIFAVSIYKMADFILEEFSFASVYMPYAIGAGVALIPALLLYLLVHKNPEPQLERLAWFLVIACAGQVLLVQVIKHFWGRPRYFFLVSQDTVQFQPWTMLDTTQKTAALASGALDSDFFKSFPSGHTAAGANMLCLVVLPLYCKSLRKGLPWIFILAVVYTLVLAFSRMVLGAHFLSDVSAGFLVSLIVFWISYEVFIKRSFQK